MLSTEKFFEQVHAEDASLGWQIHELHERYIANHEYQEDPWAAAEFYADIRSANQQGWYFSEHDPDQAVDTYESFLIIKDARRWWQFIAAYTKDLSDAVRADSGPTPLETPRLPEYESIKDSLGIRLIDRDESAVQTSGQLWRDWIQARLTGEVELETSPFMFTKRD